jgi:hypothetical protein
MASPEDRRERHHAAMAALARGELPVAQAALQRLADEGFPPALYDLGRLFVFGLVESAAAAGLPLLLRAADAGYPPAWFTLALLSLGEQALPLDLVRVRDAVHAAAQAGHPPALRALALHWGRHGDAAQRALGTLCLEHAALRGDAVSLALLGERLAAVDPARSAAIASLLQGSGLPVAPPAAPVDPARARPATPPPALPVLPRPDFASALAPPPLRERHADPWVATASEALGAEECRFVMLLGGAMLRPALAGQPDGTRAESLIRTSHAMAFDPVIEDVTLRLIQRRMVAAANCPLAHAEPLTLLRYEPGQEYRPHRDYRPPSAFVPAAQGGPGQRVATVIAYLNDVPAGGDTEFPLLGLTLAPERGGLLAFRNVDAAGQPDPRTLHAGRPVEAGSKWIATLWIGEGPSRLV